MTASAMNESLRTSLPVNDAGSLKRIAGIAFGFSTQALFAATVWFLFWFLHGDHVASSGDYWIAFDLSLALLFAVVHSAMLYPPIRQRLTLWIHKAFYDSVFCLMTCGCLLLIFLFWQESPIAIWTTTGWMNTLVTIAFLGSWVALFYSISLTGFGYQTGWTPFYYWLIRKPVPKREFTTAGAYRHLRHPIYASFLGLLWFCPRMSLDHFVLAVIWTVYIFLGASLKDQRMKLFVGERYTRYMATVPGFAIGSPFAILLRWHREKYSGRHDSC